ncbi:Golgi transport complex subunit 4 [Coemansia sp. RSA 2399]|nr:Golgi transport complex subunit 4 [Coemansia sp. RSA 2399]
MTTKAPASAMSGLDLDASGEISWQKFDELTQSLDIVEIEQAYRLLELEEARVDVDISDGVERSDEVNARFAQLSGLHDSLAAVAELLAPAQAAVDATATNAGALSARVRFLDQELSKLEDAVKMVVETDLLKQQLSELLVAMHSKDLDVAAALVHKYITTDSATLENPFVSFAQPPSSVPVSTGDISRIATKPSSPARIVADASKELTERVSFMFGTAVQTNNTKEISRCFRLFPLLGEEIRGLDMYSEFLCSVIAEKSRITGDVQTNIHALRITRIFEVIATAIDSHFPLVETHYGPGRMMRVMQRLQMEGAKRAAMVLDFFEEDRQIKRRVAQIQQADAQSRPHPSFSERGRHSEDDISDNDLKEITSILAEIVLVERQIAAFNRFMESRAMPEMQALSNEPDIRDEVFMSADAVANLVPLSMQSAFGALTAKGSTTQALFDERTGLVSNTPLSLRLLWLTETYVCFESFFLTKSVAKAMSLDDTNSLVGWVCPLEDSADNNLAKSGLLVSGLSSDKSRGWLGKHVPLDMPQTSSCVGDVFFVVRASLEHAVSTQQASAVEAVAQLTIGTVNSVFLSALEASALKRWTSTGGSTSGSRVLQLGIAPGESSGWRLPGVRAPVSSTGSDPQTAASTQITPQASAQREILVALNNLDLACTYMQKTVESLSSKLDSEWQRVPDQNDVARARKAIDTLSALSAKFSHSKQRSLEQIGSQVLKPWVRSILQQSYRDIKYVLTDEEFNDMQNDNLFQKRFMLKFGSLTGQLKQRLSTHNVSAALESAITSLSGDWERAIRQSKFNMLGGIMVEKDVREIQRYLEKETGVGLRQKFSRLVQMADVLAVESIADVGHILESQPAVDMTAGSHMSSSLSKSDIKTLLTNRIDIPEKDTLNLDM